MAEFVRLPDVAMAALRMGNARALGLPRVGKSARLGNDLIVAIGPDEWLAIAPDAHSDALCGRMKSIDGVALDVSGNRVTYSVRGPDVRWFLAAGVSYDLDHLKPGDAVSTVFARAPAILIAEEHGTFLLLTRRSFAAYVETWAKNVDGQKTVAFRK